MLTLVVTCAILTSFQPPPGWVITKVETGSAVWGTCTMKSDTLIDCPPALTPDGRMRVTLSTAIKAGDVVKLPVGCLSPEVVTP